jgi:hypothetical protein
VQGDEGIDTSTAMTVKLVGELSTLSKPWLNTSDRETAAIALLDAFDGPDSTAHGRILVHLGAIDLLLVVLQDKGTNSKLQVMVCHILQRLANDADYRELLIFQRTPSVLLQCFVDTVEPIDLDLGTAALAALKQLSLSKVGVTGAQPYAATDLLLKESRTSNSDIPHNFLGSTIMSRYYYIS